jgi:hypothetical protein
MEGRTSTPGDMNGEWTQPKHTLHTRSGHALASEVNLKFASASDSRRSELQIRKPHWKSNTSGVLIDPEVRAISP